MIRLAQTCVAPCCDRTTNRADGLCNAHRLRLSRRGSLDLPPKRELVKAENLTAEHLKEALEYDPATGRLTWKRKMSSHKLAGSEAGAIDAKGYRAITFDRHQYKAHRLIWLMVHGAWPAGVIDHIDHNRSNNALANLRDASLAMNSQNMVAAQRRNKTGFLGVTKKRSKWRAKIFVRGKAIEIGGFSSPELAYAAYLGLKRKHHEGNTL